MPHSAAPDLGLHYLPITVFILCFIEISMFNANSVDPDQMPHSAASDLGLHYLLITVFILCFIEISMLMQTV